MTEGALVHRTVRTGAVVFIVGALQFIVGMIVVQSQYPGYSLSQNYISDLGGAHSPWAVVFDASVILLGLCAIFGVLLIWGAFDDRASRGIGLGFLLIAGIGAVGVGVFPETTPVLHGGMHDIVSDVAFIGAGFGLTIVSFAMVEGPHWRFSRPFTLLCGLVTLGAIVLFSMGSYISTTYYAGLGPGGMERLIVAPVLLWAIAEGAHIARLPRFAPSNLVRAPHPTS
jgi:hypothetical membrane protein